MPSDDCRRALSRVLPLCVRGRCRTRSREREAPESREDGPSSRVPSFARRAASLALVFEAFDLVDSGGMRVRRHRLRGGVGRSSGWTANALFQGARDQHRQAALRCPLKHRGGVFRWAGTAGSSVGRHDKKHRHSPAAMRVQYGTSVRHAVHLLRDLCRNSPGALGISAPMLRGCAELNSAADHDTRIFEAHLGRRGEQ
jgi:hypothetical protein